MAPASTTLSRRVPVEKPQDPNALILEAWAQGYMIGSLIIMAAITIANMRRGTLLHKLILIELLLGMLHGTFIFMDPPVYGWYLSSTAILLNMSWSLHNVISWMKTKPFLSKPWSMFYIGTVILAQPYWIVEIYANFTYFNNINDWFLTTRPYEAIFRDPWWIFTTVNLFYNISTHYRLSIPLVVRISPRFGVLLVAMSLSIIFIILDICSVTGAFDSALPDGLNPFWKLAFVFKCLTDSIVLDDFKSALDRLMRHKLQREARGGRRGSGTVHSSTVHDPADEAYGDAYAAQESSQDPLEDNQAGHHEARSSDETVQSRSESSKRSENLQHLNLNKTKTEQIDWIEKEIAMTPRSAVNHGFGPVADRSSKQQNNGVSYVEHWDDLPDLIVAETKSQEQSHERHGFWHHKRDHDAENG